MRAVPASTYTHSSPIALRYKGDGWSATTYEMRQSSLAIRCCRPRIGSAPVASSLWVWKWRGFSGRFAVRVHDGGSYSSADTIAVGRKRWYNNEESDEKPSWPISSSA